MNIHLDLPVEKIHTYLKSTKWSAEPHTDTVFSFYRKAGHVVLVPHEPKTADSLLSTLSEIATAEHRDPVRTLADILDPATPRRSILRELHAGLAWSSALYPLPPGTLKAMSVAERFLATLCDITSAP